MKVKDFLKRKWRDGVIIVLLLCMLIIPAVPVMGDVIHIREVAAGAGLWEVDGSETQLIGADEIDMQTYKIINVVDPANNQDAATKKYVDDTVVTDHGTLDGLADDDHTQYILHSLADAANDFLIASGANTFVKKTLAETGAILEADLDHGSIQGLGDDDHTQYIKDTEFTQDSGVLVGTGAGAFAEETGAALRTSLGLAIGTDVLAEQTIGIADDNLVEVDDADAADDDYAKFTGNGLEGRSYSEVRDDLDVPESTTAAVNLYVDAGSGSDANAGTSGSPKATIQGALDALPPIIAHACTINVRGQQDYAESNAQLSFVRFATLTSITIRTVNANDEDMYDTSQASGGGNDDLDDSGESWSIDQFNGAYIWIYEGTGAGQIREILDTEATRIVISTGATDWSTNPDATSYYVIGGGATMTGTSSYHVRVTGKQVNIYGFAHTGHTAYAVRHDTFANGSIQYNYSSVNGGIVIAGWSAVNPYYNYVSGAYGYGIVLGATASSACRANVVTDKTGAGIWCYRSSIGVGTGVAGGKNFLFSNSGHGILVSEGAGFMAATVQGYGVGGEANGTNYATDSGTTSWYS